MQVNHISKAKGRAVAIVNTAEALMQMMVGSECRGIICHSVQLPLHHRINLCRHHLYLQHHLHDHHHTHQHYPTSQRKTDGIAKIVKRRTKSSCQSCKFQRPVSECVRRSCSPVYVFADICVLFSGLSKRLVSNVSIRTFGEVKVTLSSLPSPSALRTHMHICGPRRAYTPSHYQYGCSVQDGGEWNFELCIRPTKQASVCACIASSRSSLTHINTCLDSMHTGARTDG